MLRLRIITLRNEEAGIPDVLKKAAHLCGIEIVPAGKNDIAKQLDLYSPDCAVVLCAPHLTADTLRLVEDIRSCDQACSVLAITSLDSPATVLAAMRAGVRIFSTKIRQRATSSQG